uniref:Secreted protein n=1 Tax=Ixodes scapularis TaxID=6945 RepID=A0A4D5RXV2_IXOSC
MKIERTPVFCFFSLSLESLSVPLSVSPVLSNEAVVQLCDGLFATFFFLECGLQKWGCEGEGAQKAAVLFFVVFVCLKLT